MRTGNRKPRINKKPTKGLKRYLHQQYKSLKMILSPENKVKQWWYTHKQMRNYWLRGFSTSKYKPHQGAQEKARRVRQMEHGIIQRG